MDDQRGWTRGPEEIVAILYRGALGREPDPEGLAHHVDLLRRTDDVRGILEALVGSGEASQRAALSDRLARTALAALGRPVAVVDVGAQELATEEHVYHPLWDLGSLQVYGFDPLADRADQRRAADDDRPGQTTVFPFALGDGREHLLHINNDDATSSLFPLDHAGIHQFEHLADLRTVREVPVRTRRLDDVDLPDPIDLIKLDVQGAELMVLEGATRTLGRTSVVHCEVEFTPIYLGQPLFPEVAQLLTLSGFYLVDLFPKHYRHTDAVLSASPDRLLWADACFLRHTSQASTLVSQALIAAAVYRKPNLAEHLLRRANALAP
jgi:FkbM family methyltransferase